ncbi:MAG: hypothetical protein WBF93_10035 [Pirellulales bacterium]
MNAFATRTAMFWAGSLALLLNHFAAQSLPAADTGGSSYVTVDIALDETGGLNGVLFDGKGIPVANEVMTLHLNQSAPRTALTDQQGMFRFANMTGGVAVLAYADQANVLRVWASSTAPPLAKKTAVLYSTAVVRGQGCGACGGAGCEACGGGGANGMGPVASGGHGGAPGAGIFGGFNLPSIHPIQALKNPWTIGVLIGGAVAIPIALHDDEVPPSSS